MASGPQKSVSVSIPARAGQDGSAGAQEWGGMVATTPPKFMAESPSFSMLGDPRATDHSFTSEWEAPLIRKVYVASSEIDVASTPLVKHTFVWKYPCENGEVRGSFTSPPWSVGVPLTPTADGAKASVTILLPPGEHTYKFVVNGEWHLLSFLPISVGDDGNVNNLLVLDDTDAQMFDPGSTTPAN